MAVHVLLPKRRVPGAHDGTPTSQEPMQRTAAHPTEVQTVLLKE